MKLKVELNSFQGWLYEPQSRAAADDELKIFHFLKHLIREMTKPIRLFTKKQHHSSSFLLFFWSSDNYFLLLYIFIFVYLDTLQYIC